MGAQWVDPAQAGDHRLCQQRPQEGRPAPALLGAVVESVNAAAARRPGHETQSLGPKRPPT
eukprot:8789940-Lingulodinium_polyedra.AAC.1